MLTTSMPENNCQIIISKNGQARTKCILYKKVKFQTIVTRAVQYKYISSRDTQLWLAIKENLSVSNQQFPKRQAVSSSLFYYLLPPLLFTMNILFVLIQCCHKVSGKEVLDFCKILGEARLLLGKCQTIILSFLSFVAPTVCESRCWHTVAGALNFINKVSWKQLHSIKYSLFLCYIGSSVTAKDPITCKKNYCLDLQRELLLAPSTYKFLGYQHITSKTKRCLKGRVLVLTLHYIRGQLLYFEYQ